MAKFQFGLIEADVAGELRRFADALDAGAIIVQTVVEQKRRGKDDFETRALVIKYHEAKDG